MVMDDPLKLSASTMLSLKRFRVFPQFRTGRLKADKLISNGATNALKYVHSNFVARHRGHEKEERATV